LAKWQSTGTRVIALPWWEEALEDARAGGALPPLPHLRWICARASRHYGAAADWRQRVLHQAGAPSELLSNCPAGFAVRGLLADVADSSHPALPASGTFAVAQPVHLVAAIDHLRLAPPEQLKLDEDEADQLLASLRFWLADAACSLWRVRPDVWLLHSATPLECSAPEPTQAVGRNVREFQLSGPSSARLQGLIAELQMELHGHPVNQARVRARQPVVNSLWLWGFGIATDDLASRAARSSPLQLPALTTDDPWLAGLWQLHGQPARSMDAVAGTIGPAEGLHVSLRPPLAGGSASMQRIDQEWFAPLRQAILLGQVRSVHLQLGRQDLTLDRGDRWRFWRRGTALTGVCE